MGRLCLGGYKSGSYFFPLYKSVITPTLDFNPSRILLGVWSVPPTTGQSRILLGVRSVPLTTGQSVSGIFSEEFCLWTGSSPPACCHIFSWKLAIVVVNDKAFNLRITQLGPPSNVKLLSGGATIELMSVFVVINAND